MSDINELFPFPDAPANTSGSGENKDPNLPEFPSSDTTGTSPAGETAGPLTNDEITQVRELLSQFRNGQLSARGADKSLKNHNAPDLKPSEPSIFAVIPEPPPQQVQPTPQGLSEEKIIQQAVEIFARTETSDAGEIEFRSELQTILKGIGNLQVFLQVFSHIGTIFPLKQTLRHATPEQKLFALITAGDKFLSGIRGLAFTQRRQLLKTVGRYLSQVSDSFSFIQMEGENFSPQYHERVAGASTSGKTVREMHGYLIVGKQNNNIVRIGMVLT